MNIKADRDYIINILEKVRSGKLAIPEFQRDFIWDTKQVVDLFDSIMKGYPIGSLILWQPESIKFKELKQIGGLDIQDWDEKNKLYVLDGRQRLTALLGTLLAGGDFYNHICIDLKDMQILNVPSGRTRKPHILSLGIAFDTYDLVDYLNDLRNSGLPEDLQREYSDKAKKINRTLLSYELGFISVVGGAIEDAVEIFSRLNSKATEISPDYMLQALTYCLDSTFLFANEVSKIKENLVKYNFGRIDRGVVLKCVYNYLDIPFIDGKDRMILEHKKDLPDIIRNVGIDLDMAVQFLYQHCGVIDCKLLPYKYQLIMLALYFKNNRQPMASGIYELVKWFFYTTYSGYFTNSSLAVIRQDIKRFCAYSLGEVSVPVEYSDTDFDLTLPTRWRLNGVRACAMATVSILIQKGNLVPDANLYVFVLPDTGQKTWGNIFILPGRSEFDKILDFLNGSESWQEEYSQYALSEDLMIMYRHHQVEEFVRKRQILMQNQEKLFLDSLFG